LRSGIRTLDFITGRIPNRRLFIFVANFEFQERTSGGVARDRAGFRGVTIRTWIYGVSRIIACFCAGAVGWSVIQMIGHPGLAHRLGSADTTRDFAGGTPAPRGGITVCDMAP
jgi:hypothetical protein